MELQPVVEGIAGDLRKAAAVGGEETAHVADLLVSGMDATLRLHLIEALHTAARELDGAAPGATVEVRLVGRDPVLSLVAVTPTDEPAGSAEPGLGDVGDVGHAGSAGYADDELVRLTIRLPEGLKARVEEAAASSSASINSWIVAALARALDAPSGSGPVPGRRMPKRITGFVRG